MLCLISTLNRSGDSIVTNASSLLLLLKELTVCFFPLLLMRLLTFVDITMLDTKCECDATLVKVEFNKNDSPLADGETEYTGCVLCDEILNSQLHTGLSKRVHPMFRRGKGRRRGGKRRGRGKR